MTTMLRPVEVVSTSHRTTVEIPGCPRCGRPVETLDRFVLPSTDGPVEFAKVRCSDRHWFTLPVDHTLPVVPAIEGSIR